MKKGKLTIITLSALVLLLASCEKEHFEGSSPAIKVIVDNVVTKAAPVTTDSLKSLGAFMMSAYVTKDWVGDRHTGEPENGAGLYFTKQVKYSKDAVSYKWVKGGTYNWVIDGNNSDDPQWCWPNAVPVNFFSYAPVSASGLSITKGTTSTDADFPFTYSVPAAADNMVKSTTCQDIIFAYAQQTAEYADEGEPDYTDEGTLISGDGTDEVSLLFHHALAQIRFCVSTDDDTFDPSVKLSYIKLGGVEDKSTTPSTYPGIPSSGSCTFKGATDAFSWSSSLTTLRIYSQTFNATFPDPTGTGTALDMKGWTRGTYGSSNNLLYTCNDVLFVIPQTIDECVVEVGFEDVATGETFSQKGRLPAYAADDPDADYITWEAGMYYTYKIKASKGLGLTLLTPGWIDGSPDGGLQF